MQAFNFSSQEAETGNRELYISIINGDSSDSPVLKNLPLGNKISQQKNLVSVSLSIPSFKEGAFFMSLS